MVMVCAELRKMHVLPHVKGEPGLTGFLAAHSGISCSNDQSLIAGRAPLGHTTASVS